MESAHPDELTITDLEEHSKRHGRKSTLKLLSLLGRRQPLYDIVMSEGGQLLFKRILYRMDLLLDKIIDNTATREESLEYSISVKFLNDSADVLKNYKKYKDALKGVK